MITGSDLENRVEKRGKGSGRAEEAEARLAALEARITLARGVEPTEGELHCRDCFERGRKAALAVIDGVR